MPLRPLIKTTTIYNPLLCFLARPDRKNLRPPRHEVKLQLWEMIEEDASSIRIKLHALNAIRFALPDQEHDNDRP